MVPRRKFIEEGDVKSLTESTFNQTLSSSSDNGNNTFTDPLHENDEVLVVEKFALEPKVWKPFIKRYLEHYPLSTKATCVLLQHLDLPEAVELVKQMFTRFGYNDAEVTLLFKQHCAPEVKRTLFQIVSENARLFDKDIFLILEKYDGSTEEGSKTDYAEAYRRNASTCHQQRYH